MYFLLVDSFPFKTVNHCLTKVISLNDIEAANNEMNVRSYPLRRVLLEDKSRPCRLIESLYASRYKYQERLLMLQNHSGFHLSEI